MKKAFVFFFLLLSFTLCAEEYNSGRIKLVLNASTGRFLLFYLTDIGREEYQPLFSFQDPRTSFLSLIVNDRSYRMGESAAFKTRIGGTNSIPALVFESPTLVVIEEFSFIQTANSGLVNGVKIMLTIANKGEKRIQAGAKFLLDTSLGEGGQVHFSVGKRKISEETFEDAESGDTWWLSENGRFGLMGSLPRTHIPGAGPDSVHFANWKRLNDSSWKTGVSPGRNFNLLPYSIDDSAVCYYFEPAALEAGQTRTTALLFSAKDKAGFDGFTNGKDSAISRLFDETTKPDDFSQGTMQEDLITLRDAASIVDTFLNSGNSLSGEELEALQLVISRLKTKYGLP